MHPTVRTVRELDLDSTLRMIRQLPIGVAIWQLRKPEDIRSFFLVGVNQAAEREARSRLSYAVGKFITQGFPRLLETHLPDRWRRVILSEKPETLGEFVYGDSHIPEGVFWVECFPLPDRCVGVAMENITERKRAAESQLRSLQLLHSITIHLNEAPTLLEAAQFCVDEICTQIKWPVGRFFLADDDCPSRFLPNPVWHFSDPTRFRPFRRATEVFERDLSNKLALQHRMTQAQKAGLARSVGFSVIERNYLRGVLEFSSEDRAPMDEHLFRAISNVGHQLGQMFAREPLAHRRSASMCVASPVGHRFPVAVGINSGLSPMVAGLELLKTRSSDHRVQTAAVAASTTALRETMSRMTELVAESRRLTVS
jgi:hypothetical protein